jgi:hypothetical protein
MEHLARRGIPVPAPVSNAKGQILFALCGKPCALISNLLRASLHAKVESQLGPRQGINALALQLPSDRS